MALQSDPSLAGFNAYCSLAEANSYHSERLHNTAWTGAVDATKESAIIWATRNFDTLRWKGFRTDISQDHEFPRNFLFRDGEEYGYGADELYSTYMFDSSTIPQFLKDATAEAAMWLIASDVTAPVGTEGFKRIKADSIELEIDRQDRLKWLTDPVKNIIWRYLKNANPYMAKVVRT